jgi:RimJ/RimL family protein N-acetyltransferase
MTFLKTLISSFLVLTGLFADISIHYYDNGVICFNRAETGLSVDIQTDRLKISSVQPIEEHYNHYAALFGNPLVMEKYYNGMKSYEEVKAWIDNSLAKRWKEGDPFSGLVVYRQDNGKPIGHLMLGRGETPGVAEIAYLFLPEEWGMGFGTEALTALVHAYAPALRREGYLVLGKPLELLFGTARIENEASWKIMEKVGMHLDKIQDRFGAPRRYYSLRI